jgi:hypothetical protein
MLRLLCVNFDVIMISQHWLLSQNLDKLGTISDQFNYFGVSSMDLKVAANILVGRPFGGVAILWRKTLSNLIKSVDQDDTGGRYITAALHGIGTLS